MRRGPVSTGGIVWRGSCPTGVSATPLVGHRRRPGVRVAFGSVEIWPCGASPRDRTGRRHTVPCFTCRPADEFPRHPLLAPPRNPGRAVGSQHTIPSVLVVVFFLLVARVRVVVVLGPVVGVLVLVGSFSAVVMLVVMLVDVAVLVPVPVGMIVLLPAVFVRVLVGVLVFVGVVVPVLVFSPHASPPIQGAATVPFAVSAAIDTGQNSTAN